MESYVMMGHRRRNPCGCPICSGGTYYWQVLALDAHGNLGMGSQIWSFIVQEEGNMILDPGFELTQSNTDTAYWWLNNPMDSDVEWNTFDLDGQVDANGDPAIKINNRADGGASWLWEKDPVTARFTERTFPIKGGDKFYVEARVFESTNSDADSPTDFRVVVWAGDNDRLFQSFNDVSLRPSTKGKWETVSGEITISEPNPSAHSEWMPTNTYNNWDVIKHDVNGMNNYVIYRCLADGTSGAETEPPNSNFWARYDNPQLGNFGIYSEKCTTGYFLVDDVVLTKIESADDASNILLDPTFSKTTTNTDTKYWTRVDAMEWGPRFGYNSSPGFKCTIDGNGNWLAEQDGNSYPRKHPVKLNDTLWIQSRVKRSKGADGIFMVGIQEWDENDSFVSNTVIDIVTTTADETWETITTSITVSDVNAAFCHLLIYPHDGTMGYFYIDDVLLSRHKPTVPGHDTNNLIIDPNFQLTQSNTDTRYWWLDNPTDSEVEWNTFNAEGQVAADGNPAIRINNRADGGTSYLWEKGPQTSKFSEKTFPIKSGEKYYVEAKVFESIDSDADDPSDFSAVIWGGDNDRLFQAFDAASLRPSTKGGWETVSGEITIYERNFELYNEWSPSSTYSIWDLIKHDVNGNGNYVLYRCLADGTSGAGTEPPNSSYWAKFGYPQLGNFGIYSHQCTTGYFLVDNIILSPRRQ